MGGRLLTAAGVAVVAAWFFSRHHPMPCPYSQRWMLEVPRPFHGPDDVLAILEPRPGERILELGSGTGLHTLPVAGAVAPAGSVVALDVQQDMLDLVASRAGEQGIANIEPTLADASGRLPFADDSFDGAFMVTVLGEIEDGDAALRELRRVVKPGGRLVIGETVGDPHVVFPRALRARCEAAGFSFDRRGGVFPVGWFDRFS
jgi:ubiquinone/menaquinone biosynthesis C-methylase UbiE